MPTEETKKTRKDVRQGMFTGRLVADPIEKQFENGNLAEFRIAYDQGSYLPTGYITCTAWGSYAEKVIMPYLKKGMPVVVTGDLEYQEWDKDGERRSILKLKLDNCILPPKTSAPKADQTTSTPDTVEAPF